MRHPTDIRSLLFLINLAKASSGGLDVMHALPPELQTSLFNDELSATGLFAGTRLVVDGSEIQNEQLAIEGIITDTLYEGQGGYTLTLGLRLKSTDPA